MMRTRTLAFLLAFAAVSVDAAARERIGDRGFQRFPRSERHRLLEAEHPLRPQERDALERMGCRVVRELGDRQYIVNAAGSVVAEVAAQGFVAGIDSIPREWRVGRSAVREATRLGPTARLNVLFHDDVTFEQALSVVLASGGALRSPLQIDFQMPRRLEILLPDRELDTLAAADEVFQIHGPMPPIRNMNANAAALSSVTPLYSAPYNLTGAGVVVSVFDYGDSGPALADANHAEFEGRVIQHGSLSIADHPTHVTGTIAAKGNDPTAKGMAPGVRVENFGVTDDYLNQKNSNFAALGIRADNNSWGYIHGWNQGSRGWEWWGDDRDDPLTPLDERLIDPLFGAYGIATSGLDRIVRERETLIIFAAANDNNDFGPPPPCYEHYHGDSGTKFCHTPTGAADNTCTALICGGFENVRHPADGPFGSMNLGASGKNTVAVGAVSSSGGIVNFSSRGPTVDGRVKPELVARGFSLRSTLPNQNYGNLSGTSMASPVVTGISALLIEQWRKTFNGANPGPGALRVLLVHGAQDLGNPGPDYTYGFGLVNAKNSVDTIIADGGAGSRIKTGAVAQGQTLEYPVNASGPLRLTLGWVDPENTPYVSRALINDLDLRLIAPDGSTILPFVLDPSNPGAPATQGVNTRDNLERIEIDVAPATYLVRVVGSAIATPEPQQFILASSAPLGPAGQPCADSYEPNDTIESAFGRLPPGTTIIGRVCSATDLDFYRFIADRSGPITATVKASDTPMRVTLLANGNPVASVDVAAGVTGTAQTTLGSGVDQPVNPVTYTVRIEPLTAPDSIATYSLTVGYRQTRQPRTRATRH